MSDLDTDRIAATLAARILEVPGVSDLYPVSPVAAVSGAIATVTARSPYPLVRIDPETRAITVVIGTDGRESRGVVDAVRAALVTEAIILMPGTPPAVHLTVGRIGPG